MKLNRIEIGDFASSDMCTAPMIDIKTTHLNGSDEVVGELTLWGLEELMDLRYLLEKTLRIHSNN